MSSSTLTSLLAVLLYLQLSAAQTSPPLSGGACSPLEIGKCENIDFRTPATSMSKVCKQISDRTARVKSCLEQALAKCTNDPNATELQKDSFKMTYQIIDVCIALEKCGKTEEFESQMTTCTRSTQSGSDVCSNLQLNINCHVKSTRDCPAAWSASRPIYVLTKKTQGQHCPNLTIPPANAGVKHVIGLTLLAALLCALLMG